MKSKPRSIDPRSFAVRYVDVHGVRYLRLEDVAAFVRELGSSEETDVRNRLDEAARRLLAPESKP